MKKKVKIFENHRMATVFIALLLCSLSLLPDKLMAQAANPPVFIRSGTTSEPATMKTITWMTDPIATPKAVMKIAKKNDGESSFREVTGKTMSFVYNTSYLGVGAPGPDIPKIAHSVTVDGLEPGTTYIYQVGNGVEWSKTLEFTTVAATNKFSFYVFGDLQAYSNNITDFVAGGTAWLRRIARTYENPVTRPLFTIQVGDLVDREHVYNYYRLFGNVCDDYPEFANTDMIFAMGNHEYYRGINTANFSGAGRGDITKFLNGTPPTNHSDAVGSGTFFVDYANMRVFTLDFIGRGVNGVNTTQIINAKAAWLRQNLESCDKRWKVVSVHYPIFNDGVETNPYPLVETAFGSIFDEFGVHLVFSGHYHYTRRIQVRNGVVLGRGLNSPVQPNGTIYLTCGNLADNTDASVYVRGDVDGNSMTLTMINQNGVTRDAFTITTIVPVTSITVSGADGATTITDKGGTLQMQANVEPEDVSNNTVRWSVTPSTGIATISFGGLLTATGDGTVTVRATVNDIYSGGKYGEATITISRQNVTSVETPLVQNLNIFPNPFVNMLRITGAEDCVLRIMNAAGTIVHIQNITNTNEIIHLEQLSAGVYLFSAEKDGQTKTVKVVKE